MSVKDDFYTYTIDSSIDVWMVKSYFNKKDPRNSGETYQINHCSIKVISKPDRCLGSVKTPCTTIVFQGNREDCELAVQGYRLHFLSAGG